MKNIKNYNVSLLKEREIKHISGGDIIGPITGLLALAGAAFVWGWNLGREYAQNENEC